ncbi:MAG: acyl-CoA dehydrogenase family protein [Desulfomonilia bacterium]|jgi:alkylation response protein AidB-like acyl-CoA dehydrogenase|uniref:Acyl-CoA dehydrogenase n=1 Tax=anaerobic digester metagenome TaxID=1263854 RepID=A0A485LZV2_9ZZZZ
MYLLDSKEQEMFVEQLRRMVVDKVWPRAAEIDEKEEFPWDLKKIFQDMGLLGLAVPEEYGGNKQGHLYTCLAVEEIAVACVSSSLIV